MVEIMELVLIVLGGAWDKNRFCCDPKYILSGIETYRIAGLLGLAQFSMYLEDRTL